MIILPNERELSELLTPSIHQKANTNCHRLSFIHMFVQVFYHCHFDWHLDQLWSGTIQCLFTREASTSIFEGPKGTQVIDWPCHQRQWSLFCHWRNGLTRKFNLLTSLIDRFIIEATSYTAVLHKEGDKNDITVRSLHFWMRPRISIRGFACAKTKFFGF